eukprot:5884664-Amphidinium_carterae.1
MMMHTTIHNNYINQNRNNNMQQSNKATRLTNATYDEIKAHKRSLTSKHHQSERQRTTHKA